LIFVPGSWIALAYGLGRLGPRPFNEAERQIGLWGDPPVVHVARDYPCSRGLAMAAVDTGPSHARRRVFAYVAIHLALYVADQGSIANGGVGDFLASLSDDRVRRADRAAALAATSTTA